VLAGGGGGTIGAGGGAAGAGGGALGGGGSAGGGAAAAMYPAATNCSSVHPALLYPSYVVAPAAGSI
jgi:hypothetical protein